MPRLFAARMQPDAVRVTAPGPMVQEAELATAIVAAMTRADEAFGDGAGVVGGGLIDKELHADGAVLALAREQAGCPSSILRPSSAGDVGNR